MTDKTDSLVLEHLRAIRGDLAKLQEGQERVELRLSSIEAHIGAFQLSEARQNGDLDQLRKRVERIERRLELVDET